jgi:hypothetical protein
MSESIRVQRSKNSVCARILPVYVVTRLLLLACRAKPRGERIIIVVVLVRERDSIGRALFTRFIFFIYFFFFFNPNEKFNFPVHGYSGPGGKCRSNRPSDRQTEIEIVIDISRFSCMSKSVFDNFTLL